VTGSLSFSAVVLTRGDRPVELTAAVESLRHQQGVECEVVVVGNGADVPAQPDDVESLRLAHNVGIPAGRNRGVEVTHGDVIVFLDDDGVLVGEDLFAMLGREFESDPQLGIVSFRIADPAGGPGARRHVPRLRAGDPMRSSDVTTFLGGACAIRRAVFAQCGGLPEAFFYAHEETDLAWRAIDAGWRITYDARVAMNHPATPPSRHDDFYRLNARNRVWLARRRLPWALVPVYVGVWTAITVVRVRERESLRVWFEGFSDGWRRDPGPRSPIKWSTVWKLTRMGRPPIV